MGLTLVHSVIFLLLAAACLWLIPILTLLSYNTILRAFTTMELLSLSLHIILLCLFRLTLVEILPLFKFSMLISIFGKIK